MEHKWLEWAKKLQSIAQAGLTYSKDVYDIERFEMIRNISVFDKKCHPHPPSLYHVYKIFIQCEIIGGQPQKGIETDTVKFFAENELPSLQAKFKSHTCPYPRESKWAMITI